ncbi:putative cytochrome P450 family protein [Pyronema domesticum]|uniref:Similar to Cytochrome P450 52A5 acc. no. P24458 n=1 Tax=Pyronema omphalodes (strain CBS 100304) TaxID=1076935 RepID=U4LWN1_PYROM|nr:putative cytochrome P450 family protein [Pyronema domesticum]CCX33918.1 Similar to Cytochrome P450 52A5; acc. no. P24458 [Pyronema omphalodes CBS 100304]
MDPATIIASVKAMTPIQLGAVGLIGFYILASLFTSIQTSIKSRSLGCQSPPWAWDPLGLRRVYNMMRYALNHQLPLYSVKLFKDFNTKTVPIIDFGKPGYLTCDPRNIQAALATNFKDWGFGSARYPMLPILGDGIFTQDGEAWAHSRSMIRPSFTKSQIADFESLEEHMQEFFTTLEMTTKSDGAVSLKPLFSDLTMDFASEFLFGETANSLKQRREGIAETGMAHWFDAGMHHVTMSFNMGRLHNFWRPKEYRQSIKFVREFVDGFVHRALEERLAIGDIKEKERAKMNGGRYVFLNALTDNITDPIVLRNQVLNIMLAGRDTTAALLSWVLWNLARRPEVLERLKQEVAETIGVAENATLPTWQVLKDMRYLQAVIHETLRLFPSVPFSNRIATRDTVLPYGGGSDGNAPLFAPKDTQLIYSIYAMQRRPEIWGADAAEFSPDRWLRADAGKMLREVGWGNMPFSGGPRICPGQQFALTETSYVVSRLLQRYQWVEKAPGESDVPSFEASLVTPPADMVEVMFTKY